MAKGNRFLSLALACLIALPAPLPVVRSAHAAEPDFGVRPGTGPSRTLIRRGDDRLVGGEATAREPLPGGTVSLNLVEVPLAVAAKAVLADTLGWGYTLDERANGTITLQTGGPVTRDTLLEMFETALGFRFG